MHTHKGRKTTFIHHSDMSENVTIITDYGELEVDGHDLLDFIGEQVKIQIISKIENFEIEMPSINEDNVLTGRIPEGFENIEPIDFKNSQNNANT